MRVDISRPAPPSQAVACERRVPIEVFFGTAPGPIPNGADRKNRAIFIKSFPSRPFLQRGMPMRSYFVAAVVAGLAVLAYGCNRQSTPAGKDTTSISTDTPLAKALTIGDRAPKITADQWWQGTEVKEFAPDRIYVVEFWATWCGPCIAIMPHMGELQREYRDKGVTFIGFTAKDPNNNLNGVSAFLSRRGSQLGYTFAFADDRETYDAWMTAAKQRGIPCCFVVDGAGKIAYIGHPMYLDLVLPKVVAGTWSGNEVKSLLAAQAEVDGVFKALGSSDPEVALKALASLDANYPQLSNIPYLVGPRINLLVKAKKYGEAKQAAKSAMARAVKQEDAGALQTLSGALRSPGAKEDPEIAALAVQAAEAGLKVAGDKDFVALINVAESYFVLGNHAKAREYGALAIAAAESPQQKQQLEQRVKVYENAK
jgi:thiol-disulfide isomerase/thioredoxin